MRLDRRDIDELLDKRHVENTVQFGQRPAQMLSYVVALGNAPHGRPCVDYVSGWLQLTISHEDAEAWRASDQVGFQHEQEVEGGVVSVTLEKDFACLDRSAGEALDDAWAFPNPSTTC